MTVVEMTTIVRRTVCRTNTHSAAVTCFSKRGVSRGFVADGLLLLPSSSLSYVVRVHSCSLDEKREREVSRRLMCLSTFLCFCLSPSSSVCCSVGARLITTAQWSRVKVHVYFVNDHLPSTSHVILRLNRRSLSTK